MFMKIHQVVTVEIYASTTHLAQRDERRCFSSPPRPSSFEHPDVNAADRATARLRILIGQPVKLGRASFGVIRIAFGADMLVDSLCSGSPPTDCNGYEAGENGGPDALSCLLAQASAKTAALDFPLKPP